MGRQIKTELMELDPFEIQTEIPGLSVGDILDVCAQNLCPEKIITNKDATVVFWLNGDKTVVKRMKGDRYDVYNAFCAAFAKHMYGSTTAVHKVVERKLTKQDNKKH